MKEHSEEASFPFRPWVRRAGLSIVLTAAAVSAAIGISLTAVPSLRWGWMGEPFVWVYVATLWIGGLKVWLGTRRPVAEIDGRQVVLRPLHHLRARSIEWDSISGTEQMIGGDRLMVFHETPKGMRFVALNLNLVKGRREFLALIDTRLVAMGFTEAVVDRSRLLRRP